EPSDDSTSSLASVILIDRREDIAGICGRVDTAPTFAVVLHAPGGNRQLATELGIRRLQRHAEESGKVIAIATSNVALSSRARQVGIPVARRPEHVRWDAPGRRVVRLGHKSLATPAFGRYVQAGVLIGVAAIVIVLALTMAPSAKVVVYPPTETLSRVITITASKDRTDIDFANLQVPASQVVTKQHLTLAVKTTGKASVGTDAAKVLVTITNPTAAEVTVPQGTVLLSGPTYIPFLLDRDTNIPAGKSAVQQASAQHPGVEGNVAANTVKGWLPAQFRQLTVTNPAAATGGVNTDVAAVDARDVATIRQLAQDLQTSDTIKRRIISDRPHDAVFLGTATTKIDYTDPSDQTGRPSDLLLVDVDVTVQADAILQSTLDQVARNVLRGDNSVGEFIPGSVTAVETGARQVDAASGDVKTEIQVQGEFAKNLNKDNIKDAVKGKSADSARSTLKSQYGIQDSDVNVTPGWAPWLPRFNFRISVDMRSKPVTPDASTNEGTAANGSTPAPVATTTPSPAVSP
ncbi:MAG: hypothetical protein ABI305_06540, partial [Tepidiformaceae bacterium]